LVSQTLWEVHLGQRGDRKNTRDLTEGPVTRKKRALKDGGSNLAAGSMQRGKNWLGEKRSSGRERDKGIPNGLEVGRVVGDCSTREIRQTRRGNFEEVRKEGKKRELGRTGEGTKGTGSKASSFTEDLNFNGNVKFNTRGMKGKYAVRKLGRSVSR